LWNKAGTSRDDHRALTLGPHREVSCLPCHRRSWNRCGSGFFRAFETCDGTAHPWSATVVPDSGKFVGGKAMTLTFAFSCGEFDCIPDSVERTVILRGGKP
jgi:hypothetical protein